MGNLHDQPIIFWGMEFIETLRYGKESTHGWFLTGTRLVCIEFHSFRVAVLLWLKIQVRPSIYSKLTKVYPWKVNNLVYVLNYITESFSHDYNRFATICSFIDYGLIWMRSIFLQSFSVIILPCLSLSLFLLFSLFFSLSVSVSVFVSCVLRVKMEWQTVLEFRQELIAFSTSES